MLVNLKKNYLDHSLNVSQRSLEGHATFLGLNFFDATEISSRSGTESSISKGLTLIGTSTEGRSESRLVYRDE